MAAVLRRATVSVLRRSTPHVRCISSTPSLLRDASQNDGPIALNWFENAFLVGGSAIASILDPRRADMIAVLGETTAGPALPRLRDRMLESPEGRRVLRDRPLINTQTVDMEKLRTLPEGTFGHTYVTWLDRCGVTPDTRDRVMYITDPELAYVMQRYRECHDFYHAICGLPVDVFSELAIKYFEFANMGLPVSALSAAFGPLRLTAKKRERLFKEFVPWALRCGSSSKSLITVYWEERWETNTEELKKELGIWDPPPVRWSKLLTEAAREAARRAQREAAAPGSTSGPSV
ncbi:hypothetical protein BOTBODRAFT_134054 [Botryobasidium botryosum FD-172 SS1]|uniref:4-hydroxy-3-methoxy-5-polyprenylbenzoate decarboxylase n=1 Tax=Botryobasidium botryosum (strain FD-172 SS1) TaxID=930990 RepID=A0A067MAV6_BOTB1|nr:hypothetical protein BOTBODRAFT_134054 [Botryobasidium botryosum FD-172 SS1]